MEVCSPQITFGCSNILGVTSYIILLHLQPTLQMESTSVTPKNTPHKTISVTQPLRNLVGYTVHCMYNITACTTIQLTARRSHTFNTKKYTHINKLYLLHQGGNIKPNHDKCHCDLKCQNGSLFARKNNSLDNSCSVQRRLKVTVGRIYVVSTYLRYSAQRG